MSTNYSKTGPYPTSLDGARHIVCRGELCACVEGACFPAGTPIHTKSGIKQIENIERGDYVIAFDEQKKDTLLRRVSRVVEKTWYRFCRIVVHNDTIVATDNHPFYVPQLGRYIPADSLRRGMQLLALSGALLTVQHVVAYDATAPVFNFEVEGQHNYFVGKQGVLVHNTGNWSCFLEDLGIQKALLDEENLSPANIEIISTLLETDIKHSDRLRAFFLEANEAEKKDLIFAYIVVKRGRNTDPDISLSSLLSEHRIEQIPKLAQDLSNNSDLKSDFFLNYGSLLDDSDNIIDEFNKKFWAWEVLSPLQSGSGLNIGDMELLATDFLSRELDWIDYSRLRDNPSYAARWLDFRDFEPVRRSFDILQRTVDETWSAEEIAALVGKFNDPRYLGLADEFAENIIYADYFRAVITPNKWYWRYGLLRSHYLGHIPEIQPRFLAVINDLEPPINVQIGSSGGVTAGNLGEHFLEPEVSNRLTTALISGDFSNFPAGIRGKMEEYFEAGYTTLLDNATVSFVDANGVNRTARPDFLFLKEGNGPPYEVIYFDSKIHVDAALSDAQDAFNQTISSGVTVTIADEGNIISQSPGLILQDREITLLETDVIGTKTTVQGNEVTNVEYLHKFKPVK